MFRKKPVRQFDQLRGVDRAFVVREQSHRRIENLRRLNAHEIAILFFEKLDSGMGQRLQRRAETVLHFPRPVRDSPHLSMIAAEETYYPVRLAQRVGFKDDGVAFLLRHGPFLEPSKLACRTSVAL